ncbi:MAG: LysM peptidoglycan-binding domain-containing protein [Myxococcota bacterium]
MKLIHLCRVLGLAGVLVAVSWGDEASAADDSSRRGWVFPPFRKKGAQLPDAAVVPAAEAPPASGPDPDAPAGEAVVRTDARVTADGVWEWVDRMEGEQPSAEQVEAIHEVEAEELAERGLTDDLSGAPVPVGLYADPAAALAHDPLFLDQIDPSEFDIPIEVNDSVVKWMRYFTGSGRVYYERWLGRSTRYQPMMRAALAEAGLPQDLVYLSMIESGYNTYAYSHSDAAGLWQFIPSTGKVYDLRIDWWVDDRRDPEAALGAAIDFLGELHHMFGDWRLAWAAYNGGPGRVRRSIDKAGTKDFWKIADGDLLHSETQNYVPKIMAAAIIGKHPERYGFTGITYQEELTYDVAKVDGSVELGVLAECAGMTLDDLKALNPALRRYATPPEGYELRVPAGKKSTFVAALDRVPASERLVTVHHTVKRGESLSIIAGKYGTTVDAISDANGLRNVNRITVGASLIIPRTGDGPDAVAAATPSEPRSSGSARSAPKAAAPPPPPKEVVHVVARGDTLSKLAGSYGTTVEALRDSNHLTTSTIVVGQKLKVPAGGKGAAAPAAAAAPTTHTVARGETLTLIAKKYGVEAAKLQSWNGIDDPSHIEVGQKLSVSGPGAPSVAWTTYTVRPGDSLSKIAQRSDCTVSELKQWNELGGSSVIQPGQKLKIQRSNS